jgi:hypothetical protein
MLLSQMIKNGRSCWALKGIVSIVAVKKHTFITFLLSLHSHSRNSFGMGKISSLSCCEHPPLPLVEVGGRLPLLQGSQSRSEPTKLLPQEAKISHFMSTHRNANSTQLITHKILMSYEFATNECPALMNQSRAPTLRNLLKFHFHNVHPSF